jgi:hypothetical protein
VLLDLRIRRVLVRMEVVEIADALVSDVERPEISCETCTTSNSSSLIFIGAS